MARSVAVQLAPAVWRVPTAPADLVNSFVFREPDGSVTLVDAGVRRASRRILAGLAAIGAQPSDVRRVILTHAHSDHAGGAAALVEATGADVVTHERDAAYLRDGRTPQVDTPTRKAQLLSRVFYGKKLPKVVVAEEFVDDELLPVAGGLRVIHTPGHTPGHVSLLHEPTGVLITGDAIFNVRGLRWPPAWLCTDPTLNRKSADVLGDLEFDVAAFTHGSEVRTGAREAVRAFLRGRER